MENVKEVDGILSVVDKDGNVNIVYPATRLANVEGAEEALDGKAPSSHTHTASEVTGLAAVATSGKYSDLSGKPTVDSALSSTSTNAIQNKVVNTALAGKAPSSHTHNYAGSTSAGGAANTATKLATARTIRTNLASTSTASFDGSANITPGVTGILPVANGGTGATTAAAARTNLGAAASSHTHAASEVTGLAAVATSGSYGDLTDTPTIDSALSSTSTNAIQNKVVNTALAGKAPSSHTHNYAGSTSAGGAANTATKLATARTIRTNLASTSTASFDGSANVTPGVTGTLPVANGGTGASSKGSTACDNIGAVYNSPSALWTLAEATTSSANYWGVERKVPVAADDGNGVIGIRFFNDSMSRILRTADGSYRGYKVYDAANKPTASDVGAVAKTGDTMTGGLTVPSFTVAANNAYPGLAFRGAGESSSSGLVQCNATTNRVYVTNYCTDTSYYEQFWAPAPTTGRTANASYSILTTKSAVTVAQGGTGATSVAAARANLGADQAYNFLDNSYFAQDWVVKQVGGNSIDRWWYNSTLITPTQNNDGYVLTHNDSTTFAEFTQKVPLSRFYYTKNDTKVHTFAVAIWPETVVTLNFTPSHWATDTDFASSNVSLGNGWNIQVRKAANEDFVRFRVCSSTANAGVHLIWAAVYEGSYTAATCPKYVPKGKAAELAECQRYYRIYRDVDFGVHTMEWNADLSVRLLLHGVSGMHKTPTITSASGGILKVADTGGTICDTINFSSFEAKNVSAYDGFLAFDACNFGTKSSDGEIVISSSYIHLTGTKQTLLLASIKFTQLVVSAAL